MPGVLVVQEFERIKMDAWIVVTTARQIDGELVLVRIEEGFADEQKANELMQTLQKKYVTPNGPQEIFITTEYGEITCHCVVAVMPVKIN